MVCLSEPPITGFVTGLCALVLGVGLPAQAAPRLVVRAEVSEDMRSVTGTISGELDPSWTWVDPLADLPDPSGDRDRMRTFPGNRDVGAMTFDPDTGTFEARLPRRFAGLGATRHGLYANGGWMPALVDEHGLVVGEWDVHVAVPDGTIGVVGASHGEGQVRWEGLGERIVLAVVPHAEVHRIETGGPDAVVVSRRRIPKRIRQGVQASLELLEPLGDRRAAVVVAPLYSRLARAGPGAVFISDDAWRMTPGLRRFHDEPIRRGLAQALVELRPFERALVAEVLATETRKDFDEALKGVAWIPLVDQTLNDRSMPFASEVLGDAVPDHPVFDDLVERFGPHWPGGAAVVQLELVHGDGTAEAVARGLLAGEPPSGEIAAHLAVLDRPPPEQDVLLEVSSDSVTVRREVEGAGEALAVPLTIGERELVLRLDEDGAEASFDREKGERVHLDPEAVVPQTSRYGERAPVKLTTTVTGSAGNISLAPLALDGFVTVNFRRADNSRTVWSPGVFFGDQVLAEGRMSVVRMAGRPLDALRREHQFSIGPSVLWLDPRYAGGAESDAALSGRLGYTWDTKGESLFPLQGHTVGAAVEVGSLLSTPSTWVRGDLRTAGVVALHPRFAIAAQATGARSDSEFAHRAIDLGTLDGLLSVPIGTVTGRTRGTGRLELRGVPVRYADIPMLVLWGSELQITAGVEAGVLESAVGRYAAVGATGGLSFILDLGGAKPTMTGITAGWLVWGDGFDAQPTPLPQLVVRSEPWF